MVLSDWIPAILPALLTIIALWVPGLLVTYALGTTKWQTITFAPMVSGGIIGLSAVLGPFIGVRWGWPLYLGSALVIALMVFVLARVFQKSDHRNINTDSAGQKVKVEPKIWPAFVGMLITLPFSVVAFLRAVVNPEYPSQTWDALFHLSAIRWILETGNGSTLNLAAVATSLTEAEASQGAFYPAAFHDLVALTVTDNVIVASNAAVLVISCILWPLAASALSSIFVPQSTALPIFTAVLAASYTSFPERPASYGALWPTVLSYVFIPLITIALADWFGRTSIRQFFSPKTTFIAGLGAIGIATAHPTGIFAVLIVGAILAFDLLVRLATKNVTFSRSQWVVLGSTGVLTLVFLLALSQHPLLRAVAGWGREPVGSFKRELFGAVFESQLALQSYGEPHIDWVLGILTLIGAAVALWFASTRWLLLVYAAVCYLFVASAVVNVPGYIFARAWYSDPPRLGGLVPLFGSVVAGLGALAVYEFVLYLLRNARMQKVLHETVAALSVVALVGGTNLVGLEASENQSKQSYIFRSESGFNALVSKDELKFIETLPQYVRKGDVIVGDPRTGLPFVYALTGLDVSHRHINGSWSSDYREIGLNFDAATVSDPSMCSLLERNHVKYFYTDRIIFWPESPVGKQYAGLEAAHDHADAFKLVAEGGGAALYEITTCDNAQ